MYKKLIDAKKNKRGFTLVELIVVLVILGILAAILIPALTGWIDKARQQSIATESNAVYVAVQGIVTSAYGQVNDFTAGHAAGNLSDTQTLIYEGELTANSPKLLATMDDSVQGLTQIKKNASKLWCAEFDAKGSVNLFAYTDGKDSAVLNSQGKLDITSGMGAYVAIALGS